MTAHNYPPPPHPKSPSPSKKKKKKVEGAKSRYDLLYVRLLQSKNKNTFGFGDGPNSLITQLI